MENLLLSPSTQMKLKNRSAAFKLKYGSPKLKEILRERCRTRIRSKREALINSFRNIETPELSTIVKEELFDICHNFIDDDSGFSSQCSVDEILQENDLNAENYCPEDQKIMEEYEKLMCDEDYLLHLEKLCSNEVICPICMKGNLSEFIEDIAICQECRETIPMPDGLRDLEKRCHEAASTHEQHCQIAPNFIKIADGTNNLYIACLDCSYFASIL